MRVPRLIEMTVFLLLAVVVLLPRPDARAKPALRIADAERGRLAELQAELLRNPGALDASLELADLLMDGRRPDFAIAALAPALRAHPADHRLHLRQSLALADHYESGPAFQAAERALGLCEAGSTAACGPSERARLALLRSSLESIKDIDMRRNPNATKERLIKGLRPAYLKRPPAAKVPPSVPVADPAAREKGRGP